MKIRSIVHVIPYFQPVYGYEEYYHAMEHTRGGVKVTVVTSKYYHRDIYPEKKKVDKSEDAGLPFDIIRLPTLSFGHPSQCLLIGLIKTLKSLDYDALYLHGPECIAYSLIPKSLKNDKPTLVDVHKDGVKWNPEKDSGLLSRILSGLVFQLRSVVIRKNSSGCKGLLFFSSDHSEQFVKTYNIDEKIKTYELFMPVDLEMFKFSQRGRELFRQKYNVKMSDTVVTVCGRLIREKKISEIIRAFQAISDENIHLFLVGDFENEYKVEIYAEFSDFIGSGRVHILPKMTKLELVSLYSASDFALWLSHMSVGILEALACGAMVLTNKEAKKYYEVIPYEGVIGSDPDVAMQYIRKRACNQALYEKGNFRHINSEAVSMLSYRKLAAETISILEKNTTQSV